MFKNAVLPVLASLAVLLCADFSNADMIGLETVVVSVGAELPMPVPGSPDAPVSVDKAGATMSSIPGTIDNGSQIHLLFQMQSVVIAPVPTRLSLSSPVFDIQDPSDGMLKVPIATEIRIAIS